MSLSQVLRLEKIPILLTRCFSNLLSRGVLFNIVWQKWENVGSLKVYEDCFSQVFIRSPD